jgi:hypothetical protein
MPRRINAIVPKLPAVPRSPRNPKKRLAGMGITRISTVRATTHNIPTQSTARDLEFSTIYMLDSETDTSIFNRLYEVLNVDKK